jgi:dTDP-4-dehydrorhamnose reductase
MSMKVLVTGCRGMVGTNIIPLLKERLDVIGVDIEDWDITDLAGGERLFRECKPDVVLSLAAMTDVDGCEDLSSEAARINTRGPATIARLCENYKSHLIHFSTDYVFDGEKDSPYTEEDAPNPMSVYGSTKLSGERSIFETLPSAAVVRAQWLYGHGGSNFISKVADIARETGAVKVVNDQTGAPTYAKDLAWPLIRLIEERKSGIYHLANSGFCTWYEFAKEIFACLGLNVPVTPISSAELARKARRPRYSVFDCTKIQEDTGVVMRTWQEAVRDYLAGGQ